MDDVLLKCMKTAQLVKLWGAERAQSRGGIAFVIPFVASFVCRNLK